jgi:hypothetical protein
MDEALGADGLATTVEAVLDRCEIRVEYSRE